MVYEKIPISWNAGAKSSMIYTEFHTWKPVERNIHDIQNLQKKQKPRLQRGVDTVSWPRLRDLRNPEDHR